jgi:predicted dehydrogenase
MKKLRVAVIGAGAFAEACHIPGLQSHPSAEVVALCGRRYDRTRLLAQQMNVPEVSIDYQELCARADIDAVTIAAPNVVHARIAQAALRAGKHVFCEKPMGMHVREVLDMLRAAEESRHIHQVAFTYRYLYGVQELKRRVMCGDIGEPHFLRLQFDTWQGLHPKAEIGFRDKIALAGGGILYDVGAHLFDLAAFVLGPIDEVTGFTKLIPRMCINRSTEQWESVETDDIAASWFICKEGVHGQWCASRVSPYAYEKAFIEVVGQYGALKASLSRGAIDTLTVSLPTRHAWENLPLPSEASDGKPHCLHTMMRSFVDACLRGNLDGNSDASFYDGLAAQRALAAVNEASLHRRWVRLKNDSFNAPHKAFGNPYVL